jgi:hypothetical protein
MSTALTILLLTTTAGDADNVFAPAVVRATREAVGAETQIYIRPLTTFPSDESAASLGAELHADAVVELSWSLPDELRARLHLLRSSTGKWTDLEIGFRASDVPSERARTVGFAVASIFPDRRAEPLSATAPHRGIASTKSPENGASATARGEPTADSRAIDATLDLALGANDAGGSIGGGLDFRWTFASSLGVRLAGSVRVGEIPAAQITTQVFAGAVGITWEVWTAPHRRGGLGLRLDGLVARLNFSRLSGADETVHRDKWMLGADIVAEASWFFVPGAAIVGGAGIETLFGRTAIMLGDRTFTTLAPVRPLAELGLRARF